MDDDPIDEDMESDGEEESDPEPDVPDQEPEQEEDDGNCPSSPSAVSVASTPPYSEESPRTPRTDSSLPSTPVTIVGSTSGGSSQVTTEGVASGTISSSISSSVPHLPGVFSAPSFGQPVKYPGKPVGLQQRRGRGRPKKDDRDRRPTGIKFKRSRSGLFFKNADGLWVEGGDSPMHEDSSLSGDKSAMFPTPDDPPMFTETWPGKVCALCNLSERSQLGQKEMIRLSCPEGFPSVSSSPQQQPVNTPTTTSVALPSLSQTQNPMAVMQSPRRQRCRDVVKSSELAALDELAVIGYVDEPDVAAIVEPTGFFYVHTACLIWSTPTPSTPTSTPPPSEHAWPVVQQALQRRCAYKYCSRLGASVSCSYGQLAACSGNGTATACGLYFHFPCAMASGAFLDARGRVVICSVHLDEIPLLPISESVQCTMCFSLGNVANLLMCTLCDAHQHGTCAGVATLPSARAGWQCCDCRCCQVCRLPAESGKVMLCENCDKAYHPACLRPIVTSIPKYGWKCKCCRVCSDCGSRTPGTGVSSRWHNHFSVCDSCYQQRNKGCCCPVCGRAYRAASAAHRDMLQCGKCRKLVHALCDPDGVNEADYVCVVCRGGGGGISSGSRGIRRKESVDDSLYDSAFSTSQEFLYDDPYTIDYYDQSPSSYDSLMAGASGGSGNNNGGVGGNPSIGLGKGKPYSAAAKKRLGYGMRGSKYHKMRKVQELGRKRGVKLKMRGVFGVPGLGLQKPQAEPGKLGTIESDDPGMENKLVLCSADDKFVTSQDMCVMCGALGTDQEGCLIACVQCGQCYHPYCINVKITNVILTKGWRCLDCTVCEGCGQRNDESRLILCDECDISYHIYCMDPPLEMVPRGVWKCKWCAICVRCGTHEPGNNCQWMNGYTECGPCASHTACSFCAEPYSENELIIKCDQCSRWLHGSCDGIRNENDAERCVSAPQGYSCPLCRPRDLPPPHLPSNASLAPTPSTTHVSHSYSHPHHMMSSSDQRQFIIDGVCLSDAGMRHIKALTAEHHRERKKRAGRKAAGMGGAMNAGAGMTPISGGGEDQEASVLATIESVVSGTEGRWSPTRDMIDGGNNEEGKDDFSDIWREGMELPPGEDGKAPEAPEGFTIMTTESGAYILRRKRTRNLQKLGIGGFVVRMRTTRKEDDPTDKSTDPSLGSSGFASLERMRRKPIRRKPRSKLSEAYPAYLQEAFFGRELLEGNSAACGGIASEVEMESDREADATRGGIQLSVDELKAMEDLKARHAREEKQKISKSLEMDEEGSDGEVLKDLNLKDLHLPGDILDNVLVDTIIADDEMKSNTGGTGDVTVPADTAPKDELSDILSPHFNLECINSKDVEEIFKGVLTEENQPAPAAPGPSVELTVQTAGLTVAPSPYHSEYSNSPHSQASEPPASPWLDEQTTPNSTTAGCVDPLPSPLTPINPLTPSGPPSVTSLLSSSHRSTPLKMEADEALGLHATISSVLYANTNHPEWKTQYPVWSERCKQILKKWRNLSNDQKAPYLQHARDNRSALRMKKAQQIPKDVPSQPPGATSPHAVSLGTPKGLAQQQQQPSQQTSNDGLVTTTDPSTAEVCVATEADQQPLTVTPNSATTATSSTSVTTSTNPNESTSAKDTPQTPPNPSPNLPPVENVENGSQTEEVTVKREVRVLRPQNLLLRNLVLSGNHHVTRTGLLQLEVTQRAPNVTIRAFEASGIARLHRPVTFTLQSLPPRRDDEMNADGISSSAPTPLANLLASHNTNSSSSSAILTNNQNEPPDHHIRVLTPSEIMRTLPSLGPDHSHMEQDKTNHQQKLSRESEQERQWKQLQALRQAQQQQQLQEHRARVQQTLVQRPEDAAVTSQLQIVTGQEQQMPNQALPPPTTPPAIRSAYPPNTNVKVTRIPPNSSPNPFAVQRAPPPPSPTDSFGTLPVSPSPSAVPQAQQQRFMQPQQRQFADQNIEVARQLRELLQRQKEAGGVNIRGAAGAGQQQQWIAEQAGGGGQSVEGIGEAGTFRQPLPPGAMPRQVRPGPQQLLLRSPLPNQGNIRPLQRLPTQVQEQRMRLLLQQQQQQRAFLQQNRNPMDPYDDIVQRNEAVATAAAAAAHLQQPASAQSQIVQRFKQANSGEQQEIPESVTAELEQLEQEGAATHGAAPGITEVEEVSEILGDIVDDDDALLAEMGADFNILEYVDTEATANDKTSIFDNLELDDEDKKARAAAGHMTVIPKVESSDQQLNQTVTGLGQSGDANLLAVASAATSAAFAQRPLAREVARGISIAGPGRVIIGPTGSMIQTPMSVPVTPPPPYPGPPPPYPGSGPNQQTTNQMSSAGQQGFGGPPFGHPLQPLPPGVDSPILIGGQTPREDLFSTSQHDPMFPRRPLLLQEQPLLLEDLLEQEKREQEKQQMDPELDGQNIQQISAPGLQPPRGQFIRPPIQASGTMPGISYLRNAESPQQPQPPPVAAAPVRIPTFNLPPNPAPPVPPDIIVTEQDRQVAVVYETWLGQQNQLLQQQLKYYETEVQKLRKIRKSLNSKQRQQRKNGNELNETDALELQRVTTEQTALQKHLDASRKCCRQHGMLIQEYQTKQQKMRQQQQQQQGSPVGSGTPAPLGGSPLHPPHSPLHTIGATQPGGVHLPSPHPPTPQSPLLSHSPSPLHSPGPPLPTPHLQSPHPTTTTHHPPNSPQLVQSPGPPTQQMQSPGGPPVQGFVMQQQMQSPQQQFAVQSPGGVGSPMPTGVVSPRGATMGGQSLQQTEEGPFSPGPLPSPAPGRQTPTRLPSPRLGAPPSPGPGIRIGTSPSPGPGVRLAAPPSPGPNAMGPMATRFVRAPSPGTSQGNAGYPQQTNTRHVFVSNPGQILLTQRALQLQQQRTQQLLTQNPNLTMEQKQKLLQLHQQKQQLLMQQRQQLIDQQMIQQQQQLAQQNQQRLLNNQQLLQNNQQLMQNNHQMMQNSPQMMQSNPQTNQQFLINNQQQILQTNSQTNQQILQSTQQMMQANPQTSQQILQSNQQMLSNQQIMQNNQMMVQQQQDPSDGGGGNQNAPIPYLKPGLSGGCSSFADFLKMKKANLWPGLKGGAPMWSYGKGKSAPKKPEMMEEQPSTSRPQVSVVRQRPEQQQVIYQLSAQPRMPAPRPSKPLVCVDYDSLDEETPPGTPAGKADPKLSSAAAKDDEKPEEIRIASDAEGIELLAQENLLNLELEVDDQDQEGRRVIIIDNSPERFDDNLMVYEQIEGEDLVVLEECEVLEAHEIDISGCEVMEVESVEDDQEEVNQTQQSGNSSNNDPKQIIVRHTKKGRQIVMVKRNEEGQDQRQIVYRQEDNKPAEKAEAPASVSAVKNLAPPKTPPSEVSAISVQNATTVAEPTLAISPNTPKMQTPPKAVMPTKATEPQRSFTLISTTATTTTSSPTIKPIVPDVKIVSLTEPAEQRQSSGVFFPEFPEGLASKFISAECSVIKTPEETISTVIKAPKTYEKIKSQKAKIPLTEHDYSGAAIAAPKSLDVESEMARIDPKVRDIISISKINPGDSAKVVVKPDRRRSLDATVKRKSIDGRRNSSENRKELEQRKLMILEEMKSEKYDSEAAKSLEDQQQQQQQPPPPPPITTVQETVPTIRQQQPPLTKQEPDLSDVIDILENIDSAPTRLLNASELQSFEKTPLFENEEIERKSPKAKEEKINIQSLLNESGQSDLQISDLARGAKTGSTASTPATMPDSSRTTPTHGNQSKLAALLTGGKVPMLESLLDKPTPPPSSSNTETPVTEEEPKEPEPEPVKAEPNLLLSPTSGILRSVPTSQPSPAPLESQAPRQEPPAATPPAPIMPTTQITNNIPVQPSPESVLIRQPIIPTSMPMQPIQSMTPPMQFHQIRSPQPRMQVIGQMQKLSMPSAVMSTTVHPSRADESQNVLLKQLLQNTGCAGVAPQPPPPPPPPPPPAPTPPAVINTSPGVPRSPTNSTPSPITSPTIKKEQMEPMDIKPDPGMLDELKKMKRRQYQQKRRQSQSKEATGIPKKRARKGSRMEEDYECFLDSLMTQLKQLPPLNVQEPQLLRDFGACPIYGQSDEPLPIDDYYETKPFGEKDPIVPPSPVSTQRGFYDQEFASVQLWSDSEERRLETLLGIRERDADTPDTVVSTSSPETVRPESPPDLFPALRVIKEESEADLFNCGSPEIPIVMPVPLRPTRMKRLDEKENVKKEFEKYDDKENKDANNNGVRVTLTLNSEAARDVLGVLKDLANLLDIPPPTTYEIIERTTTPTGVKLGLYRPRTKDGKEGAPIDIQSILNGQAKFCKHCDVVILNHVIRKKVWELPFLSNRDDLDSLEEIYFCSSNCYMQFALMHKSPNEGKEHVGAVVDHLGHANTSTTIFESKPVVSSTTAPLSGTTSTAVTEQRPNKGHRYKLWAPGCLQPATKYKKPTERELMDMLYRTGVTITPSSNTDDTRKCLFCQQVGDGVSDGPARLLNFDVDRWVHLNCSLWSDDVYERVNGALMNVDNALQLGQNTQCALCNLTGATLHCFKNRCTNVYHLSCAVKDECVFFKNKTIFCQQHVPKNEKDNELTTLAVYRRVYVQRDENKQVASVMHHTELNELLRVGSLILLSIGQLLPHQLPAFHTQQFIYPIGYKIVRFYWSMRRVNKRCRYVCSIHEAGGRPEFRILVKEPGYEDIELRDITARAVWIRVLEPVAALRKQQGVVQIFPRYVCGEDLFGLTEPAIVRVLESLPGIDTLSDYRFKYGKNPLLELPLAVNPTGCARSEPRQKNLTSFKKPHTQRTGPTSRANLFSPSLPGEPVCPYSKQFVHSKSSQYKKMKMEWRNNVYLARSKIQGLGLYAARDLERHTMVIEYIGEIIRHELSESREKQYEARNRGIYMFRLDEERVVDATISGGLARYINHSCNPNCVAEIVEVERELRIIIFAKRRIVRGEELAYDYKFDIEDDQHKIPCLCGAPNCRKWMN